MARKKQKQVPEVKIEAGKFVLTSEAKHLLTFFIEQHPPQRLGKNLRKMLFHYLMSEGGMEESYNEDLLYDLDALFEIIDEVQFTSE